MKMNWHSDQDHLGFVSDGAQRLADALWKGIRREIEAKYAGALEKTETLAARLDVRMQIEREIAAEVRRRTPSRQALFFDPS